MATSGLKRVGATRSGASLPAAPSPSSPSQQPVPLAWKLATFSTARGGSPPDPMATSGSPHSLGTRSGASPPAAPSPSFLFQHPTALLRRSSPDPMAAAGLWRLGATRSGASPPAASSPSFLFQHPTAPLMQS